MHVRTTLATIVLSVLAIPAAHAIDTPRNGSPNPPSSAEIKQAQEMMQFKSQPVFHDANGHAISEAAFNAATKAGQRYTAKPDLRTRRFVVTLLPPGVDPPGSMAATSTSMAVIPEPGTRFAGFVLPKVGGGHLDSASLKGKPYVVDFFFADCIGCLAELPALNAYHKQYPQQRVIAITFDDARTAAGFVQQRHFDWPVVYDGKPIDDKLGIKVYPTMVVVGAGGKVVATRVGATSGTTPRSLERWVTQSLAATPHPAQAH